MRFKVEVFNLFNVANFQNPSPLMGTLAANGRWTPSANFGKTPLMLNRTSGSAGNHAVNPTFALGGPRAVQLSLRLTF